jgi:hypothetical protein
MAALKFEFDTSMNNTGVYSSSSGTATNCFISNTHTVDTSGSLYFNGSSGQQFKINNPPTLSNSTGMTFSVWVKYEFIPTFNEYQYQRIFDIGNSNETNIGLLLWNNDGRGLSANCLFVEINNDSTQFYFPCTDPVTIGDDRDTSNNLMSINDNIWHHYCLTISNLLNSSYTIKFYVDGALVLNRSGLTSYPELTNTSWLIGQSNFSVDVTIANQQRMYVNNFEFYNSELTASQVSTIYAPIAASKLSAIQKFNYWGLVLYYPFENDILNYATGTGVNDATSTGGIVSTPLLDLPNSYKTNGTNQNFRSKNIKLNKNGFTVACWVKFNSLPVNDTPRRIFEIAQVTNTTYKFSIVLYANDKDSKLTLNTSDGTGNYYSKVFSSSDIANFEKFGDYNFVPDTNWHHYCVTVGRDQILELYVDGTRVYVYNIKNQHNLYTYDKEVYAHLGRGNGTDVYTNANYSSLMVFNRGITQHEIGLLMGVKNAVLNGYFNSYKLSANSNGSYSLLDGGANAYNSITGWYQSKKSMYGLHTFVISKDTSWIRPIDTIYGLLNDQQYWLGNQIADNSVTYKQFIYLEEGMYNFSYKSFRRELMSVGVNRDTLELTSSILYKNGSELATSTTPTISYTSLYNHNQSFTVTSKGVYIINFDFINTLNTDLTIFLSGVKVNPIKMLTSAYSNVSNPTESIDSRMALVEIKSGKVELTIPPSNSFFNTTMYKLNNSAISFSSRPLYMHGTRSLTGFKIDDIDIGNYFQQTDQLDGSYGYCFANNYNYDLNKEINNIVTLRDSGAKTIWAENSVNGQPRSYWLYHTFNYSGSDTSGRVQALVDDLGTIYLNDVLITSNVYGAYYTYTTDVPYTYPFTNLRQGLNYIRVAVRNVLQAPNPATFIAAFYDNANTLLAITNQQWTWSKPVASYQTDTSYNDVRGWLPFVVNLELRGTIQNALLPLNSSTISSYVLGAPSGVTYSNITTLGTYNLSSSSSSNFNILVNLPPGYVAGTYTGSLTVQQSVNLDLSNTTIPYSELINGNIRNYVTGAPVGTTYTVSSTSTPGVYNLSSSPLNDFNIIVNLPYGYVAGTYTGSITVTNVVNLTMSSVTLSSSSLPINVASYVTGAIPGTTYSSSIDDLGDYILSTTSGTGLIQVTLPDGYVAGSYTGTITVTASQPSVTGLTTTAADFTPQYPSIAGYEVLYITSGTGTVTFYKGFTVKGIFLVGGGRGGSGLYNNGRVDAGEGGSVLDISGLNITDKTSFSITVGSGGAGGDGGTGGTGGAGTSSICAYGTTTYTASGGTTLINGTSNSGTQFSLNGLYYGGDGGYIFSSTSWSGQLGGGGGAGGSRGGHGFRGGGINEEDLSGGLGGAAGTSKDGLDGDDSSYGGGGGGSSFQRNDAKGGAGGTGNDGSARAKTQKSAGINYSGGGGGAGGKNTGGGGGAGGYGGSGSSFSYVGDGGKGGSGIVIIYYQ